MVNINELKKISDYEWEIPRSYRQDMRGESSNAQRLAKRVLCIPANEKTTQGEIEYVAESIRAFYHG